MQRIALKYFGLSVLMCLPIELGAQAYQCTDSNGKVTFQDRECRDEDQSREIDLERIKARTTVLSGGSPDGRDRRHRSRNLVENPGFDRGLEFWKPVHHPEAFTYDESNGHKRVGALSVRSIPPESPVPRRIYEAAISQCIKLDAGKRYRFAASFKSGGKYQPRHANRVNLYWYQSDDCTTYGEFGEYLEPNPDKVGWQRVVSENRLRSLNARAALIQIAQSRTALINAETLWDDVELTPTEFEDDQTHVVHHQYTLAAGVNYLNNPEFRSSLDGWRYSGDTKWSPVEGKGRSGAARLAIFSDNGGYGAHSFSQCVNLGANRTFTMGAEVKVDPASNQEGGGIFRLAWYKDLDCRGQHQAGFSEDRVRYEEEGWQQLVVERIEAPSNAQSAGIYFTRGVQDAGLFAYFIDDVYFRALD